MRLSFLLLLLLVPSLAQESSGNGEFKISTEVDLVLLDVSVKDAKGGYVTGLTRDNFHVYENGVPQKITEFAIADEPIAIGLVIDESGSMRSKRPHVIAAGVAFIEASNPLDQIFVVNFNDTVRRGLPKNIPFTDDVPLLHAALSQDPPQGQTALYDAIAAGLHHLESATRDKKTLVVVSDGGDNCSKRKFKDLLPLIEQSRATIYTVGLFDSEDPDSNPKILKRMADVSGGECFLPGEIDQIGPICQTIAKDIRNRYTIGYLPARTDDKGATRKIRVVAATADSRKLIVRTRTSYLLPERVSK